MSDRKATMRPPEPMLQITPVPPDSTTPERPISLQPLHDQIGRAMLLVRDLWMPVQVLSDVDQIGFVPGEPLVENIG